MSEEVKSLSEPLNQIFNSNPAIRQKLLEQDITTVEQFCKVQDFSTMGFPKHWMASKCQDMQLKLDPTKSTAEKMQEQKLRDEKRLEEINESLRKLYEERDQIREHLAAMVEKSLRVNSKSAIPTGNPYMISCNRL